MANPNKPSSSERRGHSGRRSSVEQSPQSDHEGREQERERASRKSYNKDRSDR